MHLTKPRNLQELETLLGKIQAGTCEIRLGNKALATLKQLCADPSHSAVTSIACLAQAHGVNPSTLTRLSKSLGFEGFSQFQQIFRQHVVSDNPSFSEKMDQWIQNHDSSDPALGALQQIARDEINNLDTMVRNTSPTVLNEVAELLHQARQVRFYGSRQFYSLACFNAYCLGLVRSGVGVLGASGQGFAHALSHLSAEDAVVLVGAEPYTRATVEVAEIARKHDIKVVAITDSYSSPLALHAHHVLVAPTSGVFYANNTTSAMILSETILALVAGLLGPKASERLRQHEKLVDELGIAFGREKNL